MLAAIVLFCLFSPLAIARYHPHEYRTDDHLNKQVIIWGDFDENNEIRTQMLMPEGVSKIDVRLEDIGCYDLIGNPVFPVGMRLTIYDIADDFLRIDYVDGFTMLRRSSFEEGLVMIEATCPFHTHHLWKGSSWNLEG